MRDFQGRRKWHKILRSDAFSFILLVVTLLLIRSVWDVYKKDSTARINTEEAQRKLDSLQRKKEGLEKEIARLNTERGVEEELRRRFQVAKPGEEVLVIVDKKEESSVVETKSDSIFSSLWRSFVGMVFFWR